MTSLNIQYTNKSGYITPVALLMMIASVAFSTFLFEFGRMVWVRSSLDSGVSLSVRAGAISYGDTLSQELEKAYQHAKTQAEEEILSELDSNQAQHSEETIQEMIKDRTQELIKEQLPEIKSKAQEDCENTSKRIANSNQLSDLNVTCTDSIVKMEGIKRYEPKLISGVVFHTQDISQSHEELIIIHKE